MDGYPRSESGSPGPLPQYARTRRGPAAAAVIASAALLFLSAGCSTGSGSATPPGATSVAAPSTQPPAQRGAAGRITLTSGAFTAGSPIPAQYTCDGSDRSPELRWSGAPSGTRSFALVVHDPDAPGGDYTHWLLYDVPSAATEIREGGSAGTPGANDFGKNGYGGPCPPPGSSHHYIFEVYALDCDRIGLPPGARRSDVEAAMRGHILAEGQLQGNYQRH